jgi:hypothetical protein
METHGEEILAYYNVLFSLKKRLKILPRKLKEVESLDDYAVEKRPLLLFGDCKQKWIDKNCEMIRSKIESIAYGTYYYGSPQGSCDLKQPYHRNRHIYP